MLVEQRLERMTIRLSQRFNDLGDGLAVVVDVAYITAGKQNHFAPARVVAHAQQILSRSAGRRGQFDGGQVLFKSWMPEGEDVRPTFFEQSGLERGGVQIALGNLFRFALIQFLVAQNLYEFAFEFGAVEYAGGFCATCPSCNSSPNADQVVDRQFLSRVNTGQLRPPRVPRVHQRADSAVIQLHTLIRKFRLFIADERDNNQHQRVGG